MITGLWASLAYQAGLWIHLDSLWLDYSWGLDMNMIHFHQIIQNWCFQNPVVRCSRLITPGDDRHPKRLEIIPNLVEIRTKNNLAFKGGKNEIYPIPMGRDEWEYQPWVACRWYLFFSLSLNLMVPQSPNELKSS